ncbi:hypothetical protein BJ508DRAFT_310714 [Ascobolus immersus RN42]|uniref:PH domain-containing protein n=1 Tax=Ascobolus immersus RN42 TaxID=1160509 RepID=A0A3N4HYD6_ASCIM|nr:hypothetical protein BJ508DRAFT_310714 [Ascobolus immersus RN42]
MTEFSSNVPARYKSVSQRGRAATGYDAPPPPTGFFSDSEADLAPKRAATIARSRSRYRRKAPPPAVDPNMPMPNGAFASPHRSPNVANFHQPAPLRIPDDDDFRPRSSPKSANSPSSSEDEDKVQALKEVERFIKVNLEREEIEIPILSDTTADLFVQAVLKFRTVEIGVGKSILIENFNSLGLERPVRSYELMKDVVHGWDMDTQNYMKLHTSPANKTVGAVPTTTNQKPFTNSLYFWVHKSKKWKKREVEFNNGGVWLHESGLFNKNDDRTLLCRMTDWDIYDIQPHTQRNLKVPKRFSFALKSQEKASFFQDGAEFVYYFATDHQAIYDSWKQHLAAYRSYHLFNVKGLGQGPRSAPGSAPDSRRQSTSSEKHRPVIPARPLVSIARGPLDPVTEPMDRLRRGNTTKAPPRTAGSDTANGEEVFAPTGLLGRTYTQKVNEMERNMRSGGTAFSPSSVPNPNVTRHHRRTASDESDRQYRAPTSSDAPKSRYPHRSATTRVGRSPKPLIDFDDEPQNPFETPRHRTRAVSLNRKGPLIDNATGPPMPDLPPVTTYGRSGLGGSISRQTSLKRSGTRSRPGTRGQESGDENPFTGGGLVSRIDSAHAQGAFTKGHGVATSRDAYTSNGIKPLMDFSQDSIFQQGSLLATIEKKQGRRGPVLDREDGE